MKHLGRTTVACAALALTITATAFAQQPGAPPPPPPDGGYYPPPPPPEAPAAWERHGLAIGFGFGLGGMSDSAGAIECVNCDYNPASFGVDFHIGAMLNPRLSLQFEAWLQGQQLDAGGTTTLVQTMGMVALQYWVTPQLWLKGGLGAAHLSYSIDDGYRDPTSQDIADGGAVMGAIGYEILSSQRFSIDLQGRLGAGTYDGINEQIETGMVSLGFNWY